MSNVFTIGTRGSALALWQAHALQDALQAADPELQTEIRVISTNGDRILDKPLEQIGDKGLFTKELEAALLAGEVDACVHSMKDVPAELPEGCCIAAMLPRADVRDVLVCGPCIAHATELAEVPAGARLGTGSLRRSAQLRALFPHIEPTPAVGQGAIGVEVRADDERALHACALVNDEETFACVEGERRILAGLQGGCQVPLGAYLRFEDDDLLCDAVVLSLDGKRVARATRCESRWADPLELADDVVSELLVKGAAEILDEIRGDGVQA